MMFLFNTPGGTRTHTVWILSPLPAANWATGAVYLCRIPFNTVKCLKSGQFYNWLITLIDYLKRSDHPRVPVGDYGGLLGASRGLW